MNAELATKLGREHESLCSGLLGACCWCLWLLFQKKTSGLLPWESLLVIPSWAHWCLEKYWHQATTLVWNCRMKEELSVYLNSVLTTAWSIWKRLGCLWNVLYFLCLKVGDKIPADLLRAEVASGLMLLKKRPHFWPQLHRTWAQMWKTHPNPHSAAGLNFYLLNTREALPNRRCESSQAVSGLILHLDESCRAGGTGVHVPRWVFPTSEE